METKNSDAPAIPGYEFGSAELPRSPVTLEELAQLERTVGWSKEDAAVLARVGRLLDVEAMVDAWRSVIGEQPHLARWFVGKDARPDEVYKARVKRRFVQWVRDVFFRPHDQAWLDYQEEIGKRHTPAGKNRADDAQTPALVPLRYTVAFAAVIMTSIRGFLDGKGVPREDIARFQDAWTRAIMLHVTLWTRAYAAEGLW